MGRPIGSMRRFLKKVRLPAGTRYAILATAAAPQPDKKTGRVPTEEEMARWQRVIPIMNEILETRAWSASPRTRCSCAGSRARWRQAGRTRSRRSRPDCPSRPRNPIRRQAPGEGASSMSGLYEPLRAAELSSAR